MAPRTVFEGTHGFFHAFTNGDIKPDFSHLRDGLGDYWTLEKLAFKPYPCGTMVQPFIDCALRLSVQGVKPEDIKSISCPVGEGTVHRLWEPLSEKRKPVSAYSAKFSVPYGIAIAIVDGKAGLEQFEEERVHDKQVCDLANCIDYSIDPENEYPQNYSGHLSVLLHNGETLEIDQPYLRGGAHERLSDDELTAKFHANAAHGGLSKERTANCHQQLAALLKQDMLDDLSFLRE